MCFKIRTAASGNSTTPEVCETRLRLLACIYNMRCVCAQSARVSMSPPQTALDFGRVGCNPRFRLPHAKICRVLRQRPEVGLARKGLVSLNLRSHDSSRREKMSQLCRSGANSDGDIEDSDSSEPRTKGLMRWIAKIARKVELPKFGESSVCTNIFTETFYEGIVKNPL